MIGEILMIAFLSILAALAWYPCCCAPATVDCPYCTSGAPATVSITISGASDAQCDACSAINATHVIVWDGYAFGYCRWYSFDAIGCTNSSPADDGEWQIDVRITQFSGWTSNTHWMVTIRAVVSSGGLLYDSTTWQGWNSGSTADIDCDADHSLTKWKATVAPDGAACDLSSVSVSLS